MSILAAATPLWQKFFSPARQPFFARWLILGACFISVVNGLDRVVLGFPTKYLLLTISAALLAGLLLGNSSIWLKILGTVILLGGMAGGFIHFAGLGAGIWNWLNAAIYTLRQAWEIRQVTPQAGQKAPMLDLNAYNLAALELRSTSGLAFERLRNWGAAMAVGQPIFDLLAANLLWTGLLWLLAAWAGWSAQRRANPLQSTGPAAALLAISLNYAGGDERRLLPVLLVLGLWLAADFYAHAQGRWHLHHIDYAEEIRTDIGLTAAGIVGLLVGLGLVVSYTPRISLQEIATWMERQWAPAVRQQEEMAESLGLQRPTPKPAEPVYIMPARLPRQHLLGSGPELSQRAVMSVQVLSGGAPAPEDSASAPRYYWRSLTYDDYTGQGWRSSKTEEISISAGMPVLAAEFPSQRLLEQEIRLINSGDGYLYASGALYSSSQSFRASWRLDPGDEAQRSAYDLFGGSIASRAYKVLSYVNLPGETSLNQAPALGPDWLMHRYARQPDVPQRVLDLAARLANLQDSDYARALAIQNYLREIPYTLDLPAPPADRDVVDYYLFDLRRGYCDYAASAMVVLARAAGLPARLVTGYASGSYDPANRRYLVTEADAHSWPEIYFDGIGWVEFEPTGGLPAEPLIQKTDLPAADPDQPARAIKEYQLPLGRILLTGLGSLAGLWLLLGLFDHWRLSRLAPEVLTPLIYRRYRRLASLVAQANPAAILSPGQTPLELATAVKQALQRASAALEQTPILGKFARWAAGRAGVGVELLTGLYNQAVYASPRPDIRQAHALRRAWDGLHLPLQMMSRLSVFADKLIDTRKTPRSHKASHDKHRED